MYCEAEPFDTIDRYRNSDNFREKYRISIVIPLLKSMSKVHISIENTIFKSISIAFLTKFYQHQYQWFFCTKNFTAVVILKGFL